MEKCCGNSVDPTQSICSSSNVGLTYCCEVNYMVQIAGRQGNMVVTRFPERVCGNGY